MPEPIARLGPEQAVERVGLQADHLGHALRGLAGGGREQHRPAHRPEHAHQRS